MLFEGQGIQRVFESYLEYLESEASEKYPDKHYPAEFKAILEDFRATDARLRGYNAEFAKLRAQKFLDDVKLSESRFTDPLIRAVSDLYKTLFNTSAFQSAVFITFFALVERYNKTERDERVYGDAQDAALFAEYVEVLNTWFRAKSENDLKQLFNVFLGKTVGSASGGTLKVNESAFTLRKIVIPGELRPDEWPRFRYIILEMWKSQNAALDAMILESRSTCRYEVMRSFYDRMVRDYCADKGIEVTDITDKQKANITKKALDYYYSALEELHGEISDTEKQDIASHLVPPAAASTVDTVSLEEANMNDHPIEES